ncbi:pre-peptidase C-terminal domain-containing protein [Catalinimonas alkaloidigena]|uniref:Pre-peptidase C-terminal domain-containing protein n=1 Tax=Catalinimonas alkaloidigena TaxID=1075417 RepID=A0A1G9K4L3_9BACT|nr:M12 family metallopeptidase [Catalinimonas alkaloidigena]SDL44295.1 pre-peptidase C-terminal domain-containing protein [Catalinimonas alkaloidigena]
MAQTDKVCFDRILPGDLRKPLTGPMLSLGIGPTRAAFQIAKLWPNGSTLHFRFLGGTAAQQAQVQQYSVEWTQYANLTFVFDNAVDAQIRIAFNDDGAWSYIGTDALSIPADQPTMNFGWLDQGVILHEFGHMLGMIHEHQNPRDNPIEWNKPVVNTALSGPPNFWNQTTIDHNLYEKYETSQINGSTFDPDSIMLYSFPAEWTLNGFHTDPNEQLSDLDRQFAELVYPNAVPTAPVELPVFEGATQAEIGQPGEEDLFSFQAKRAGRYTVETSGSTDVVMTLFGPTGDLLAQDDDSGTGRNARIVSELIPGTYTVQVRHYNTSNGTGTYGIKVEKE